jgi:probable O-glycosylation ligase (exosortase A-associated)
MQSISALRTDARWWAAKDGSESANALESESDGRNAFIALVVFTCILLLAPQNWFPVLAHLRIASLAGGAATVFLLWDSWQHRKPLHLTREIVICFVLAGWAFLTVPLSYWPGGSLSILLDMFLKAAVVFFLLAMIVNTAERLRFIATTLLLCTVPLTITAVKDYLTGKFIAGTSVQRIFGYQNGLAANPNDLALLLNLVIPLGIATFLGERRRMVAFLCALVIAADVVGVILTMSRGGFLGLATIGVVYFIKLVRRSGADRRWAIAVAVLVVLSLPLLPSSYWERMSTIANMDADPTGSAQERWQGNVAAAHFVMQRPLVGAGIGMSILALNEAGGPRWHEVHNVYLQYAVDLGLPGLILFLLLFWGVFRQARSARKRAAAIPELRNLFLLDEGLQVSLIVFAVAGLFHPVAYHFYFYYFGGLALAARSATDRAILNQRVAA